MEDETLVREVLDAIDRQDWPAVAGLIHPYVHWDTGSERVRGRRNVLGLLAGSPVPAAPDSWELRDGQIYRWTVSRRPSA